MNKKPTGEQPKKGEVVMHCGHSALQKSWRGFKCKSGPVPFERADGTKGESSWIFCCKSCYRKTKGNISKLVVMGDIVWPPSIIEE